MEAYQGFASVYDLFMEETDYGGWVEYLKKIWEREGLSPKLIADLGCGTGNVTELLAEEGIGVIGIDYSSDMLAVARDKAEKKGLDILYLNQDMREFELFGTVNCMISLFDSLNYITDESDLLDVFRLVNMYLHPGGLFIFDLNTEYKFREILGDNTFTDVREDAAYIWENEYDPEERINTFYMTFFIQNKDGTYQRKDEVHEERAYSLDTIQRLIQESGLALVDIFDAYTFESPKKESERVFVVAKEVMKQESCEVC